VAHLDGGSELTDRDASTSAAGFPQLQPRAGSWLRAGRRLLR